MEVSKIHDQRYIKLAQQEFYFNAHTPITPPLVAIKVTKLNYPE
jgi:hypothetical protein